MNHLGITQNLDIESFINNVATEANQGTSEDKKVTSSRIKVHSEKIQDKRQEQLNNILEQMKESGGNGCLKFFKSFFKIFDILLKPLSAITMGRLKLEIGTALESLDKALKNKKTIGLKIDGAKINNVLESIKKLFHEDVQRLEQQEEINTKETQRIMQMIGELQESLKTTTRS